MVSIINWSYLIQLLLSALAALIAIVVHETAHGYTAYFMGDTTAKEDGRLSLNPLHHIDWIGALCLIFFHIGWAKPVPINPYMFKNRKLGIILVSISGPLSNFVLAVFALALMCVAMVAGTSQWIVLFLYMLSAVSIGLGVFNLIPIPPLDGSKVLAQFLPMQARIKYLQFERYGWVVLFLLIYFGNLSSYLNTAVDFISNFLLNLVAGVIL